MSGVWIEDLAWPEVGAKLAAGWPVIVPIGARAKEHGHHLPMQTDYLVARILAEGGTLNAGGVNATYGLFSDQLFQIYNLDASNDTLRFSSVMDDSSYGAVTSSLNTNSTRIWYQQNFIDYELFLLKSQVGSPYAIKGEANWIIDASVMSLPPSRQDVASNALGEGHLILDGTENAVFEVTDSFGVGTTIYRYHVNLRTGVISRM